MSPECHAIWKALEASSKSAHTCMHGILKPFCSPNLSGLCPGGLHIIAKHLWPYTAELGSCLQPGIKECVINCAPPAGDGCWEPHTNYWPEPQQPPQWKAARKINNNNCDSSDSKIPFSLVGFFACLFKASHEQILLAEFRDGEGVTGLIMIQGLGMA